MQTTNWLSLSWGRQDGDIRSLLYYQNIQKWKMVCVRVCENANISMYIISMCGLCGITF